MIEFTFIFGIVSIFKDFLSSTVNKGKTIKLPEVSNEIKCLSNSASWCLQSKSTLLMSNFSASELLDRSFMWLAVNIDSVVVSHRAHLQEYFLINISLK